MGEEGRLVVRHVGKNGEERTGRKRNELKIRIEEKVLTCRVMEDKSV